MASSRLSRGSIVLAAAALVALAAAEPGGGGTLPRASCFGRKSLGGTIFYATDRFAPSKTKHSPSELLDEIRARFGDTSLIRGVRFGPVPAAVLPPHTAYFGRTQPLQNALWLYVSAPAAEPSVPHIARTAKADWEANLFAGAVRDALCLSGTRPFAGWTLNADGSEPVSDLVYPFGERFRNESRGVLLSHLRSLGRRYDFTVESARFLHPYQLAPVVVLHVDRPAVFAGHQRVIFNSFGLSTGVNANWPFEGYYVEARDDRGPIVIWTAAVRGSGMGTFYCAARVATCPQADLMPRLPKKH